MAAAANGAGGCDRDGGVVALGEGIHPSLFIGLMSGTSLDGVDGVLADFGADSGEEEGEEGELGVREGGRHGDINGNGENRCDGGRLGTPGVLESASCPPPRILASSHVPMPPALRAQFLALQAAGYDEIAREAAAANALAELYAVCVHELLVGAGGGGAPLAASAVRAVGAHGQTIRHRPGEGYTVQSLNAALLAERVGIDVVADLRSRDVAAGGQGAPLVPLFHRALFLPRRPLRGAPCPLPRNDEAGSKNDVGCGNAEGGIGESRDGGADVGPGGADNRLIFVVNIGGIANASVVSRDAVLGHDTGPGNVFLDMWASVRGGEGRVHLFISFTYIPTMPARILYSNDA